MSLWRTRIGLICLAVATFMVAVWTCRGPELEVVTSRARRPDPLPAVVPVQEVRESAVSELLRYRPSTNSSEAPAPVVAVAPRGRFTTVDAHPLSRSTVRLPPEGTSGAGAVRASYESNGAMEAPVLQTAYMEAVPDSGAQRSPVSFRGDIEPLPVTH